MFKSRKILATLAGGLIVILVAGFFVSQRGTKSQAASMGINHNFTTSGTSSSVFNIKGNLSTSEGIVNYNGMELTQCLKMETSTKITFKTSKTTNITLVFNEENSKDIKIDGLKKTYENGVYTCSLSAGNHSITKASTASLFYISLEDTTSYESENNIDKASNVN